MREQPVRCVWCKRHVWTITPVCKREQCQTLEAKFAAAPTRGAKGTALSARGAVPTFSGAGSAEAGAPPQPRVEPAPDPLL